MQIQLPEWLRSVEVRTKSSKSGFSWFVEQQTDLFVESMQDAADNHWQELQWKLSDIDQQELGSEMERWWNYQIRCFQRRLKNDFQRNRVRLLKRRLRREIQRRRNAEHSLQVAEVDHDRARQALDASRELTDYLESQFRCRECDSWSWG